MLCFKDKTFCSSICNNFDCSANFTPAEKKASEIWWELFNSPEENPPVAFSDFKINCLRYIAPEKEGKHIDGDN